MTPSLDGLGMLLSRKMQVSSHLFIWSDVRKGPRLKSDDNSMMQTHGYAVGLEETSRGNW